MSISCTRREEFCIYLYSLTTSRCCVCVSCEAGGVHRLHGFESPGYSRIHRRSFVRTIQTHIPHIHPSPWKMSSSHRAQRRDNTRIHTAILVPKCLVQLFRRRINTHLHHLLLQHPRIPAIPHPPANHSLAIYLHKTTIPTCRPIHTKGLVSRRSVYACRMRGVAHR